MSSSLPQTKLDQRDGQVVELDGRHQRSEASRAKIVAAMLEICAEGEFEPSAEAVAQRAGVGRRTVFRHFNDMDSLFAEMHHAMLKRVEHLFAKPIESTSPKDRLLSLVARRIALFEDILPIKTAADAHRHRSAFLRKAHEKTTLILRDMLKFVVDPLVQDEPERFEAIELMLSFEAWRRLRREQNLSVADATNVVQVALARLVAL
jgi:AcrR family transcriptional regulator